MSKLFDLARSAWSQSLGWIVAGVFLMYLVGSQAISSYNSGSVALACAEIILVLAATLLAGWAGIPSFAHPALLAVGAYTAAYGSEHSWSLERTLLIAMLLSCLVGAFLGYVGARFSDLYAALLTIAFALIALEIINRWPEVTGGDEGKPVNGFAVAITSGDLFAATNASVYATIGACVVCLIVATWMRRTSLRMRMSAAKSHALAARTLGIAPEWQFALAFAVSGAAVGMAGVFFALTSGFVSSESFSLDFAVLVIAASVLGGFGSIGGAVVGGAFIALCPKIAQGTSIDQQIIEGVILVLALLLFPSGLVPSALARLRRLRTSSTASDEPTAEPDVARPDAAPIGAAPDAEVLLEVRNLSVNFSGLKALSDISLEVRQGEVLAIIGPNGAGKTTLLNVLSGIAGGAQISGAATWKGSSLLSRSPQARRRYGIARTFQHAEVFPELTVRENVMCLRRWPSRAFVRRVDEVLSDMGLSGVADEYPSALSFGLRKRLDLARAVVDPPQLLLLDEPFGGLDAHERTLTAATIRRLCRDAGTSVLIIDHVLDELFALAGRAVAFDFGISLFAGEPHAVIADERVRNAYLGSTSVESNVRGMRAGQDGIVLDVRSASFHYDGVMALEDISFGVARGSILGVVGANGAGKSTLGRILQGTRTPFRGTCEIADTTLRRALVPEGRGLFGTLSIRENLEVAGYGAGLRARNLREAVDEAVAWLPERLQQRLEIPASSLSGGEQQMLAIARALVAKPDVVILDEPALGLAPTLVDEVYRRIDSLAADGTTVIVLEQLLSRALDACHRVIVLRDGQIAASGVTTDEAFREEAEIAYFGVSDAELLVSTPQEDA